MQLKVLIPSCVFLEQDHVIRIVAETPYGSFGILPHRLDCVAALVPGILLAIFGKNQRRLALEELAR